MSPVTIVRGTRVVLPGGTRPACIYVTPAGSILDIGDYNDEIPPGVHVVDAREHVILPGLVDTHVHINEPGRTEWEGFAHATRAAAAGGVTTVIDMPLNSVPSTTTVRALEAKRLAAARQCHVDVGFWGGLVPGNVEDLAPLACAGVRGFKCFLSPSGVDEFGDVSEKDLRAALPVIARLDVPLLVHAELPSELREAAGDPRCYRTWLTSRPSSAETGAIDLLVSLAKEYGTRIHVVHLASADALPALHAARAAGLPITVETCPHYLAFSAEEIADGATPFKCAPPIREAVHREQLWSALGRGDIDLVATDHSPAPPSMKQIDAGDFLQAWGGIASLQLGLASVWTGAAPRGFRIEDVVHWMAAEPARLAGLSDVKGSITAGADADLVVWDPHAETTVDAAALHHRHQVTPYAGVKLKGRVITTLVRGRVVFDGGQCVGAPSGAFI